MFRITDFLLRAGPKVGDPLLYREPEILPDGTLQIGSPTTGQPWRYLPEGNGPSLAQQLQQLQTALNNLNIEVAGLADLSPQLQQLQADLNELFLEVAGLADLSGLYRGVPAGPNPPSSPSDGDLWWELPPPGTAILPYPWQWRAVAGRWLSERTWESSWGTGRLTGNDTIAPVPLNLPEGEVWAEEVVLTISKTASAYLWGLRLSPKYDVFPATYLTSISWPTGTPIDTPTRYELAINQLLGPACGIDWRLLLTPGQPQKDARFSATLTLRRARP